MSIPSRSVVHYEQRFHEINKKIRRKFANGYGSWELFDKLTIANAAAMCAANLHARLALLREIENGRPYTPFKKADSIHKITIVPDKSHCSLPVGEFDYKKFRRTVEDALRGASYIAFVDIGPYINLRRIDGSCGRIASWHVHCLVWNASDELLESIEAKVANHQTFLGEGADPFHKRRVKIDGAMGWLIYSAKFPVSEKTAWRTRSDLQVIRQKARDINPGTALAVSKMLGKLTLQDVVFGGGEGKEFTSQLLDRTRQSVAATADEKKADLRALVFGA